MTSQNRWHWLRFFGCFLRVRLRKWPPTTKSLVWKWSQEHGDNFGIDFLEYKFKKMLIFAQKILEVAIMRADHDQMRIEAFEHATNLVLEYLVSFRVWTSDINQLLNIGLGYGFVIILTKNFRRKKVINWRSIERQNISFMIKRSIKF